MPCYHPLVAWRGPVLASGKRSVVFKPSESTGGLAAFPQKLPCGQCVGCRLDYSLDWATRCLFEAQTHKKNCFVTLTYDNKNLPLNGQLDVRVWQDFIRELRRRHNGPIRYFHAGEYGSRFGRPHYHALLFGCDFPDRSYFKTTKAGSRIDTSKLLTAIWGKGHCSVGDVSMESAAYVARYCMKDSKDVLDKRYEDENGKQFDVVKKTGELRTPQYVTMSRRPGIAKLWYGKFSKDVFPHDYVMLRGSIKMPPPRYFDGLYDLENPLDMKRIKLHRMARCTKKEVVWSDVLQKNQVLDVNRDDRLAVMEEVKEKQVSLLSCGLESGQ